MRVGVLTAALFGAGVAVAAPTKPSTKKPAATKGAPAPSRAVEKPPAPLATLPSIARVTVVASAAQAIVATDVNLPRGELTDDGEPLDFWVAFGAPGPPRALDAHLLSVADGELEAGDDAVGESLVFQESPRRPVRAHPLLGRETMAGVAVHVPRAVLARALLPGGMATLRIRSAIDSPPLDADGGRTLVVRLGASRGTPLTLGRLVVREKPGSPVVARAEARLCGPEADPHPLAVSPRAAFADRTRRDTAIAPVLAVRRASDDLCVRYWLRQGR